MIDPVIRLEYTGLEASTAMSSAHPAAALDK
jgi:hypothetical protein